MKSTLPILLAAAAGLIIFLCCSCASTSSADFGCKCAAVYGNYDSCVRAIEKSLATPDIRAKLEETPEQAAYYRQMLAVSELQRGNLKEGMRHFEESLHMKPSALTYFFRAKHFLREGKYREAEIDIEKLGKLLSSGTAPEKINYYQFLLALLPGDRHDELWHKRNDAFFLQSRLAWLKQQLARNRNPASVGLPIWAGVSSEKMKQTVYGMPTAQLRTLLGKPDWSYQLRRSPSAMAGLTAWCYRLPEEKKIVEFLVSEQSKQVGNIRLYDENRYRRQDGKRQGATWFRPKNAPYTLGTSKAPR